MGSPFASRWARLGLYAGLAAAGAITLYWVLAAGRADWADWWDDPAIEAHRWASAVSFPTSFLAFHLFPALKQFAYWPWVVVLGPPLNGMALGALGGFLRDRAGTRGPLDLKAPRWATMVLLTVGVPLLWVGLIALVGFALALVYFGPALFLAPQRVVEPFLSLLAVAWLAVPLAAIAINRAVPTGWRPLLWVIVLGAAVFTMFRLVPRARGITLVFPSLRNVLAWLVIGFGAVVAAAPAVWAHAVPSPDQLRFTRSALRYALIVCATPPPPAPVAQSPEVAWAGLILASILFALSIAASQAGWHPTRRAEAMQLSAGVLMYLCGRAAAWPLPRVFGAAIALLALHLLVVVPLLIAIR